MEKTKINVKAIIEELEVARGALKEGIINATLSKKGKENVANDLKEVIALAEEMKAGLKNESNTK